MNLLNYRFFKYHFLLTYFVLLKGHLAFSQSKSRIYQTQSAHQRLLSEVPDFRKNLSRMERQIANYRMLGY